MHRISFTYQNIRIRDKTTRLPVDYLVAIRHTYIQQFGIEDPKCI